MRHGTIHPAEAELDEFIEAYERAQAEAGEADLARFLPAADSPLYLPVLSELVRVDLEYSWQRGRPRSLDDYRTAFPQLFQHGPSVRAIAFEEYRLRGQAGQTVQPGEYRERFGVDVSDWPVQSASGVPLEAASRGSSLLGRNGTPTSDSELAEAAQSFRAFLQHHGDGGGDLDAWLAGFAGNPDHARLFRDMRQTDPGAAERLADAVTTMPAPGDAFLGFQLVEELGRGAFGRVFLARQGDLADRLVALKVSTDLWGESQTLAQLQHTHIVPIYSIHRGGPFQAVCMPYLGATTLADVLRKSGEQRAKSGEPKGGEPESGEPKSGERRAESGEPRSGERSAESRGHQTHDSCGPSLPTLRSSSEPSGSPLSALRSPLLGSPLSALRSPPFGSPLSALRSSLSFEEAVLSLAGQLADGLAHAHERGILHRDLKPANVLLADDGRPMLLDFNLSEDTKLRGCASAAMIGGTLPYMAPEHLDAFDRGSRSLDARSDVYALGVVLYELLTGRLPFAIPRGPLPAVLAAMRKDRHQSPPRLRRLNPRVTPAVESIVRHCLEPDAARRYQSARELEEDLKRQLENRPLRHAPEPSLGERARKLFRRHPRLTLAGIAGVLLLVLGGVLAAREVRLARVEARNVILNAAAERDLFKQDMRQAQFHFLGGDGQAGYEPGLALVMQALGRYGVLDNPVWRHQPAVRYLEPAEQDRLQEDVAELLLLAARATVEQAPLQDKNALRERAGEALTWNERAQACFPDDRVPRVVWLQRAGLLDRLDRPGEAARLRRPAPDQTAPSPRDLALLASEHALAGRLHEALPLLEKAVREDRQRFTLAFDLAICYDRLDRLADAAAWYNTAIALSPRLAPLYLKHGIVQQKLKNYEQAIADLDKARQLDPRLAGDCLLNRALVRIGMKRYPEAIQDLEGAAKQGAKRVRVYLVRARARQLMGDKEGAKRDRARGLAENPTDEAGWLARGSNQPDPKAALNDFNHALELSPRSLPALQNKAHILAERLHRNVEALAVLDELVKAYPAHAPGWAGRAVLRARQGDRAGAHADARAAGDLDTRPSIRYQLAGVYALTSRQNADDRSEALKLLSFALGRGYGLDLLDRDTDLDAIRNSLEFRRLVESAKNLNTSRDR